LTNVRKAKQQQELNESRPSNCKQSAPHTDCEECEKKLDSIGFDPTGSGLWKENGHFTNQQFEVSATCLSTPYVLEVQKAT
jgi:hypothetical protein